MDLNVNDLWVMGHHAVGEVCEAVEQTSDEWPGFSSQTDSALSPAL